jgi:DnaJ-class molecular chaperone
MNYYQLLELDTTSPTSAQLKKAFRDVSKKYHPDKNTEDTTEKFIEIKVAAEIL